MIKVVWKTETVGSVEELEEKLNRNQSLGWEVYNIVSMAVDTFCIIYKLESDPDLLSQNHEEVDAEATVTPKLRARGRKKKDGRNKKKETPVSAGADK